MKPKPDFFFWRYSQQTVKCDPGHLKSIFLLRCWFDFCFTRWCFLFLCLDSFALQMLLQRFWRMNAENFTNFIFSFFRGEKFTFEEHIRLDFLTFRQFQRRVDCFYPLFKVSFSWRWLIRFLSGFSNYIILFLFLSTSLRVLCPKLVKTWIFYNIQRCF